jgi:hypothetical protein
VNAVDETREAWLGRAANALAAEFLTEETVPPLRISVGWPGGRSNRQRTIGQCWSTTSSEDGVNQIFMSPIRGEAETVNVLGTLLHEMIHAVDDCKSGHSGNFIVIARSMGLKAKWTTSANRTEELTERLTALAADLGAFPHAPLLQGQAADAPKKQTGSRMLKIQCPDGDCGYVARTTQKWIDLGLPFCYCGAEMEVV